MFRLTCPKCLDEKRPVLDCGPEVIHIYAGEEIVRCPRHVALHVSAATEARAWMKWNLAVEKFNRERGIEHNVGYDMMHEWFSLSYASFIVLPRLLTQSMPSEWQAQLRVLLDEYDEAFPCSDLSHLTPSVSPRDERNGRRFTRWPGELLNYRRPNPHYIDSLRK